jgi:hypothetical protein
MTLKLVACLTPSLLHHIETQNTSLLFCLFLCWLELVCLLDDDDLRILELFELSLDVERVKKL